MKNFYTIAAVLALVFFASCKVEKPTQTKDFKNTTSSAVALPQKNWIEIGSIKNGVPEIIGDKQSLIKSWNYNLFQLSRIKGNFTDVSIEKFNYGYQLIFTGKNFKSSFYTKVINSNKLLALGSTACTVTKNANTTSGCQVLYDQGEPGYCSPCETENECTKTINGNSMISFNFKES